MKIYVVLELEDINVVSVRTAISHSAAHHLFDAEIQRLRLTEVDANEWSPGADPTTLRRFAGDDIQSLELHETESFSPV